MREKVDWSRWLKWFIEVFFGFGIVCGVYIFSKPPPTLVETALLSFLMFFSILLFELHLFSKKNSKGMEKLSAQGDALSKKIDECLDVQKSLECLIPISRNESYSLSPHFQKEISKAIAVIKGGLKGEIVLDGITDEQIWMSHSESFGKIAGAIPFFYATCIVPKVGKDVDEVFTNSAFNSYCKSSYEAVRSGKIEHMKKLYIVPNRSSLDSHSFFVHLEEFVGTIDEIAAELKESRILSRLIVLDEYHAKYGKNSVDIDYMIWGNEVLAQSQMGANFVLTGLKKISVPEEINKRINSFEEVFDRGIELAPLLKDKNYQK